MTILACATVLEHAGRRGNPRAQISASAIRTATLSAARDGVRTMDLGGIASTTDFVDAVRERLRLGV
jgi:isocitrate/isopropylmalate dehydrogenase